MGVKGQAGCRRGRTPDCPCQLGAPVHGLVHAAPHRPHVSVALGGASERGGAGATREEGGPPSVSGILGQDGWGVVAGPDGGKRVGGLRATPRNRAFNLIISDIKMPDRSGYEVFRTAREVSPDTPVILMTGFGYDPHHSIVRASQEGLQSFLFKPFKAVQLIDEVRKALAPPKVKKRSRKQQAKKTRRTPGARA